MDYCEFMYCFREQAESNRLKARSSHFAMISFLYEIWEANDFASCKVKDVGINEGCAMSFSTIARTRRQLVEHGLLSVSFDRRLISKERTHSYTFGFIEYPDEYEGGENEVGDGFEFS